MNRRDLLKRGIYAGAGYAFAEQAHGAMRIFNSGVNSRLGQRQPNIIFLLTDDQRWDAMGCTGNSIIQTPTLDYLASRGSLFCNAYVTSAICMSSRASILTGQYMRRHGIKDFNQCLTSQQFEQTYCAVLRNAGYRTGFIGKHGLASFPSEGFDYYKGFPGDGSYNAIDDEGNPIHLTTLIAKQAVEFLDESKKTVPFCLSISFKAPHVEGANTFLYDTRYEDLYQGVTIPLPATYDDQYWYAFPERFRQNNEARSRWEVRFSTPQMYQYSVKGYYRLISGVDVAVRTIMKRLRQLKLDDDTIIIITSDNGFYLAELGMAGKWYGHGPSIRVPLVIYDPRLPKSSQGRVISETALNVDIAPTILSYAGVRVPELMQGKDLSKVISGQAASWRTDFLYEQMFNYGGRIPVCEGVVQQQYKYIRFFGLSPVYEQLYDVPNDPNEIINLADDPSYASLLDQMRARCDQLIAESA